mmetsp:Transcript_46154/g.98614  ORF Transcript_46154/g.98614 Transcript_46154/m.98614 type:complete len:80 (+) Transcript_46154:117-356(+)
MRAQTVANIVDPVDEAMDSERCKFNEVHDGDSVMVDGDDYEILSLDLVNLVEWHTPAHLLCTPSVPKDIVAMSAPMFDL